MNELADWMLAAMRAQRLTQRALADRSGVDHSTISRLLRGERNPTMLTVRRLAKVLGAPPWDAVEATHPSRQIEHALRSDRTLTNEDVVRVMNLYLDLHHSRLEAVS